MNKLLQIQKLEADSGKVFINKKILNLHTVLRRNDKRL